ncbi:hypothetical protein B0H14DRAFT_3429317 [Mycena olivaceomarginata]|nr:hypothetical protein B0H14DRAFT_3429317 [Mycena olivaceomarginata]
MAAQVAIPTCLRVRRHSPTRRLHGGKIKVVGKGETQVSFTSITDIAGFVAHILTTAPPSELEDRILRLEGARSTLNGLARYSGPLSSTSTV